VIPVRVFVTLTRLMRRVDMFTGTTLIRYIHIDTCQQIFIRIMNGNKFHVTYRARSHLDTTVLLTVTCVIRSSVRVIEAYGFLYITVVCRNGFLTVA